MPLALILPRGVCDVILFILDVRLADAPAGATQEEGHTGFLHQPFAVLDIIFIARKVQLFPFPSSTVKSNFVYPRIIPSPLVRHDFTYYIPGIYIYIYIYIFIFCKEKSQFV